jgi:hypothetical protein
VAGQQLYQYVYRWCVKRLLAVTRATGLLSHQLFRAGARSQFFARCVPFNTVFACYSPGRCL